jgi:hypothetical protein
MIFY